MPTPNIILNAPYILCTLANSPGGDILPVGNSDLVFGYVEMINSLCDSVSVGEFVFFNIKDAKAIQYGSTIYYLLDESFNIFKQEAL